MSTGHAPVAGKEQVCEITYVMVKIPPQTFTMGYDREVKWGNPRHSVTLTRAFSIGVFPVTQGLWEEVMGCNTSRDHDLEAPVTDVTWYDACAFANRLSERDGLRPAYRISGELARRPNGDGWLQLGQGYGDSGGEEVQLVPGADGYRLPTDAEWECAARGGTDLEFAGSDELNDVGWYSGNSGGRVHPVGQKRPNGNGLFDMSGNVEEWCWDAYQDLDGPDTDPAYAPADPTASRVKRGGSWRDTRADTGVRCRSQSAPAKVKRKPTGDIGFRLARSEFGEGDVLPTRNPELVAEERRRWEAGIAAVRAQEAAGAARAKSLLEQVTTEMASERERSGAVESGRAEEVERTLADLAASARRRESASEIGATIAAGVVMAAVALGLYLLFHQS